MLERELPGGLRRCSSPIFFLARQSPRAACTPATRSDPRPHRRKTSPPGRESPHHGLTSFQVRSSRRKESGLQPGAPSGVRHFGLLIGQPKIQCRRLRSVLLPVRMRTPPPFESPHTNFF